MGIKFEYFRTHPDFMREYLTVGYLGGKLSHAGRRHFAAMQDGFMERLFADHPGLFFGRMSRADADRLAAHNGKAVDALRSVSFLVEPGLSRWSRTFDSEIRKGEQGRMWNRESLVSHCHY